jgi:hypothetical protein
MRTYPVIKRTLLVASLALILWGPLPLTYAADQSPTPEIMAEQPSIQRDTPGAEITPLQGTWVDEIRNVLGIYKESYPASNFGPYLKKLNLIGEALDLGDGRIVKIEMGSFFTMLARRAYGINAGAADELSSFTRIVMPAQEYGIIFPRNESEQ